MWFLLIKKFYVNMIVEINYLLLILRGSVFFLLYGRLWCVLLWIDGRLRGLVWLLGLGFVIVFEIWYFFFKFVYCDFFWLMISEGGRRYDFRIVVWGLFDWNLNLGLKNYLYWYIVRIFFKWCVKWVV